MKKDRKINVAIVGLELGAGFIPIYRAHPLSTMHAICQRTREHLERVGEAFGIEARYTSHEEMLKDPAIDVVHVNTPPHANITFSGILSHTSAMKRGDISIHTAYIEGGDAGLPPGHTGPTALSDTR